MYAGRPLPSPTTPLPVGAQKMRRAPEPPEAASTYQLWTGPWVLTSSAHTRHPHLSAASGSSLSDPFLGTAHPHNPQAPVPPVHDPDQVLKQTAFADQDPSEQGMTKRADAERALLLRKEEESGIVWGHLSEKITSLGVPGMVSGATRHTLAS